MLRSMRPSAQAGFPRLRRATGRNQAWRPGDGLPLAATIPSRLSARPGARPAVRVPGRQIDISRGDVLVKPSSARLAAL